MAFTVGHLPKVPLKRGGTGEIIEGKIRCFREPVTSISELQGIGSKVYPLRRELRASRFSGSEAKALEEISFVLTDYEGVDTTGLRPAGFDPVRGILEGHKLVKALEDGTIRVNYSSAPRERSMDDADFGDISAAIGRTVPVEVFAPVNIVSSLKRAISDEVIDAQPLNVAASLLNCYLDALVEQYPLEASGEETPFFRALPGFLTQVEKETKIEGMAKEVAANFIPQALRPKFIAGLGSAWKQTPPDLLLEKTIGTMIEARRNAAGNEGLPDFEKLVGRIIITLFPG